METREGDGLRCVRRGRVRTRVVLSLAFRRRARSPSHDALFFFFVFLFSCTRSATDQISGETVAIKLVTRVFEKVQLAKRALREITLLRHFANHENITGLIDVDAISPDFQELFVLSLSSSSVVVYIACSLVPQIYFYGGELYTYAGSAVALLTTDRLAHGRSVVLAFSYSSPPPPAKALQPIYIR